MKRGRDGARNSLDPTSGAYINVVRSRVAFTTAFMLFSRREDNAKDLESFASEKGKILSLNDRNIFFRCIFYDFLWELPKSGAKSSAKNCDISTMF